MPEQSPSRLRERVVIAIPRASALNGLHGTVVDKSGTRSLLVELDEQPSSHPSKRLWFDDYELEAEGSVDV